MEKTNVRQFIEKWVNWRVVEVRIDEIETELLSAIEKDSTINESEWPGDEAIKKAVNDHFKHDGIFSNGSDYECADALEDMRKGAFWGIQWLRQQALNKNK